MKGERYNDIVLPLTFPQKNFFNMIQSAKCRISIKCAVPQKFVDIGNVFDRNVTSFQGHKVYYDEEHVRIHTERSWCL